MLPASQALRNVIIHLVEFEQPLLGVSSKQALSMREKTLNLLKERATVLGDLT
jgi:hypothetical protein